MNKEQQKKAEAIVERAVKFGGLMSGEAKEILEDSQSLGAVRRAIGAAQKNGLTKGAMRRDREMAKIKKKKKKVKKSQ